MEIPEFFKGMSIKRFLQGSVVGAIVAVTIGFNWGGWMTGGAAEKMTSDAVQATSAALYSPVCVDRYIQTATVEQRAAFAKESEWMRDTFIEKAGFATPPGSTAPNNAIADACAETLSKQLKAAAGQQATKG